MLRFEKIVLGYDNTPTLEIPHLHIAPKERLVITGSSGSGKSTLLRVAAGFIVPLEGSIYLETICVSSAGKILLPPHKRTMGMVFQDLALWPHMNVRENISFGLKMQGITKAQREAQLGEMLETIGLQGYADRPIDTLSGGEQQRVALARALITRPKIILMDEPLSSLDEALNRQLRREIVRLQERFGFTLLYVTHNNEEAQAIATRSIGLVPKGDGSGIHTVEGQTYKR